MNEPPSAEEWDEQPAGENRRDESIVQYAELEG